MAGRAMAAPKPAPDLFLEAAKNMGVTPERTLVIEDSATGVQAARAAGMDVWVSTAVARDRESQEIILKEAGAERVFSTFIHIAEALNL
jgi:beta-phosphoglucomutase-like phosphatase (HAD superfamily)